MLKKPHHLAGTTFLYILHKTSFNWAHPTGSKRQLTFLGALSLSLLQRKCFNIYKLDAWNAARATSFVPLFLIIRQQLPLITAESFDAVTMGEQYSGDL
jgi:hypothetical protein